MKVLELSTLGKIWATLLLAACAFFATSAYSASKTVLVLGDSLSAEYGIKRGSGWVPLLERQIKLEKIDAAVINASVSGETTSGGATRLPALLAKYRPQVVLIELGANDGLRGLPLASISANLNAMIKAAKKANARVLLIGIRLPPNYGADYTKKFFDIFPKVAAENKVPLVPYLLNGVSDRPELFQQDRLHPSAEAQSIMLNNVWPSLKPLLQ